MNLRAIDKFHQTRLGAAVFGLVELVLALLALNWALDNGSLWVWLLTFILLFGFVQNFIHMVAVYKK